MTCLYAIIHLHYAIIHPHLIYSLSMWSSTFSFYLAKLQILQNKATQIIANSNIPPSISPQFYKLGILKLSNLYVISIHSRATRLATYRDNLYLPRYKINKLQRSFKFQGVKIWNSIPNDLRKLSFNQFKIKYKKILLSNY